MKRLFMYGSILVLLMLSIVVILIPSHTERYIAMEISSEQDDLFQLYYADRGEPVSEEKTEVLLLEYNKDRDYKELSIGIPEESDWFRLDLGNVDWNVHYVKNITFVNGCDRKSYTPEELYAKIGDGIIHLNNLNAEKAGNDAIVLRAIGPDPYMVFDTIPYQTINTIPYYIAAAMSALIITVILYKYVYLRDVYALAKSVFSDRRLLISLGLNDFKVKYAGSYFGVVWAFVQPVITIAVFGFVFHYLKAAPISDMPFYLWLTAGIIPWFFFADAWNGATNSFVEYSYLVKKVVFKIDILPLVKILSAFFVHLFFIAFMIVLYAANGVIPAARMFGILYYMICMVVLLLGLSFITASVVVFFKDLTQIMNICLQILMWLTPIMWSVDMLPYKMVKIFQLNPMYYIVQGYRNCMIGNEMLIPSLNQTVYFWVVAVLLFFTGISLFRRLKVHFADVL